MSNSIDQDRLEGGVYFSDPIYIGDEPEPSLNGGGINLFEKSSPSTLNDIHSPSLSNRSRRRPGTMPPGEKTLRNIFLEEMHNFHIANEEEYHGEEKQLPRKVENEIQSFQNSLGIVNANQKLDKAIQEQNFLHQGANDAKNQHSANKEVASAFYGESPLYLSRELPLKKLTELIQDNTLNTPEQIQAVWDEWDKTSKASQQQKLASRRFELITNHFESAANSVDNSDLAPPSSSNSDMSIASSKKKAIETELALHKWYLPDFLSDQIFKTLQSTDLVDQLHTLKQAAQKSADAYKSKVASYATRNPNINSPLLKPELEALKSLVDAQRSNKLGQLWADYHKALLNAESARHLENFAQTIEKLEHRAVRLRRASEQAAAERARAIAAHQQALSALAQSQQSVKQDLDRTYGAAVSTLPKTLAAELQPFLDLAKLAGQPLLDAILDQKAQIDYVISQKSKLSKSKEVAALSFAGSDTLKISDEQYKDILRSRSKSAEQAYQIHQAWSQAYKDALDARLYKQAADQLTQLSAELSDRYAEHAASIQHADNELSVVKHAADANRLWSVVAGPAAPNAEFPSAIEKTKAVAEKLFARQAIKILGRALPHLALLYPTKLNNGELSPSILATAASGIGVNHYVDLEFIASRKGSVDVTHRLVSDPASQNGQLKWVEAGGNNVGNKVRVRAPTFDPITQSYSFTRDGETTPTLTWIPQIRPESSSTHLPVASKGSPVYEGAAPKESSPKIYNNPEGTWEPDDYILSRPAELGGGSLYILFKDPRDISGVAKGEGKPFSGTWLGENTRNEGAPIPSSIADLLRGRSFPNFDRMRQAIWQAVASDGELSSQFSKLNLSIMKEGNAPYPRPQDQSGGRNKFEIHHKHEVAQGGEVYDFSNLVIMTPVQHIQHHRGKKP